MVKCEACKDIGLTCKTSKFLWMATSIARTDDYQVQIPSAIIEACPVKSNNNTPQEMMELVNNYAKILLVTGVGVNDVDINGLTLNWEKTSQASK